MIELSCEFTVFSNTQKNTNRGFQKFVVFFIFGFDARFLLRKGQNT